MYVHSSARSSGEKIYSIVATVSKSFDNSVGLVLNESEISANFALCKNVFASCSSLVKRKSFNDPISPILKREILPVLFFSFFLSQRCFFFTSHSRWRSEDAFERSKTVKIETPPRLLKNCFRG